MKVIVIGSGKGGVGKSTFCVHLATVLKSLGLKVGVIDADIYGPSLKWMFPPDRLPEEEGDWIVPATSRGIEVISIAYFNRYRNANMVRAPIANAAIEQFLQRVKWSDRDVLLIDLPPGTGDIHLTIMQTVKVDGAIAITTPQKVAALDVEKALELFEKMAVPVWGIVENMSYYVDPLTGQREYLFGQGAGEALAKKFKVPLLGKIPIDALIAEMTDLGRSIFEVAKESVSKKILSEIAIEISSKICDDRCLKEYRGVRAIDNIQFEIDWGSEKRSYYYRDLQKRCPCARCFDEEKRVWRIDPEEVSETLGAFRIHPLGNYALRFEFTSGCSRGIYTWQQLLNES